MRLRIRLAGTVFAAASTAVTLIVLSAAPATADKSIEVGDLYFCEPSNQGSICQTTIAEGETITWTVVGGFHTVSQCTGQTFSGCPADDGFDSGQLSLGIEFEETFDTPGRFYYLCQNHPSSMRGIINVNAQETPAPSPTDAPTPSPTTTAAPPSAATVTPAAVPSTGADTSDGGAGAITVAIVGALIVAAGAVVLRRSAIGK